MEIISLEYFIIYPNLQICLSKCHKQFSVNCSVSIMNIISLYIIYGIYTCY